MSAATKIGDGRQFAAVDVETTGLFPSRHDRIIEIGVVQLSAAGDVIAEYSTLLNPERDVGPVQIHGIEGSDVVSAPRFQDVAGDILDHLADSIVVGHNVRFDIEFLTAEFGRLGIQLPTLPSLCTLGLSWQLEIPAATRRLQDCCVALGVGQATPHVALQDARAVAQLLFKLLERLGPTALADLQHLGPTIGRGCYPEMSRTGLVCSRELAKVIREEEQSYLARLVSRLPMSAGTSNRDREMDASIAYLEFLDRVLEDRRISNREAEALVQFASGWGISPDELDQLHRQYLRALAIVALADGVVTDAERRDLGSVSEWLGLGAASVGEAIRYATAHVVEASGEKSWAPTPDDLKGKTICFTGEMSGSINGEPVTREMCESIAARAGMTVVANVSRRLDILVSTGALSQSTKARKARELGTRIISDEVFWRLIGVRVD